MIYYQEVRFLLLGYNIPKRMTLCQFNCHYRWPPVSYLEAMEEYKKKYASEDEENKEVINNEVQNIERGRQGRTKHEKCHIM